MVEVRFKPADVGSVADGSVTTAKLAAGAVTGPKLADTFVKGAAADTTANKGVIAIGYDLVTGEVVVDHEP